MKYVPAYPGLRVRDFDTASDVFYSPSVYVIVAVDHGQFQLRNTDATFNCWVSIKPATRQFEFRTLDGARLA